MLSPPNIPYNEHFIVCRHTILTVLQSNSEVFAHPKFGYCSRSAVNSCVLNECHLHEKSREYCLANSCNEEVTALEHDGGVKQASKVKIPTSH